MTERVSVWSESGSVPAPRPESELASALASEREPPRAEESARAPAKERARQLAAEQAPARVQEPVRRRAAA